MDLFATFALLFGLELVLGIDNILVISILVGRLPEERRKRARLIGLSLALVMRIALLGLVVAVTNLKDPILFHLSVRDLVLLAGGMFLLWKAIKEIHHTVEVIEEKHQEEGGKASSVGAVIRDIVLLDIVFSLDSVITAIGLTGELWVIVAAVVFSFLGLLAFAGPIGEFILARPSLKILALSFLVTIGVTLFLEGMHQHVPKGYIYLPMGFALGVELLQMRWEHNRQRKG